ncbi:MAG: SDR family NAD(P)-dependent oxidoreductase [Alphaproteobacteria bacterium]|nr:SDR family NAD(P)-dependent oxidoreductase [Alphaproteobacteria bacterium]
MSYKGKKVLVTGADGFIGSHLAEALARDGARVTALALYTGLDRHGWLDEIDADLRGAMRLVRGDVRDAAMMLRLAEGHDVVFHLAALIAIPYSYDAPHSYIGVNVTGTANILEAARTHGIGRVVHTSTSEVYGTAQTVPIAETHPLVAQSPYAASKIAADKLAESYALSFDLPVYVLRPFNTYGPRQSERAVISSVIRQALDPKCDAIRVGDVTPVRDFNYVADTVSAFLAIGSSNAVEHGRPYNSGTGTGVSIAEMIDAVRAVTGANKPVVSEEQRARPEKSEVRKLVADASLLAAAAGWKPRFDLRNGIAETAAWWRDRVASGRTRADASYLL